VSCSKILQTKIHFEGRDGKNVKKLQDQAKAKPWCAPWCTFGFCLFIDQSEMTETV
jgi:hypothetical protein